MLHKFAELLNEIIDTSDENRRLVAEALMHGHPSFAHWGTLPIDLIVSTIEDESKVRVSVLGMINTALRRAGEEERLIAVVDDDEHVLRRFEVGPYPNPVPLEEHDGESGVQETIEAQAETKTEAEET